MCLYRMICFISLVTGSNIVTLQRLLAGLVQQQFSSLLSAAVHTQQFLYAPGTAKNIKSHIRTFLIFCAHFQRAAVPADSDTLVAFSELMSVTAGYAHIKHIFASIKLLHVIYHADFIESDFRLDSALQSLKRRLAKTPLRVLPMTPDILKSLYVFSLNSIFIPYMVL